MMYKQNSGFKTIGDVQHSSKPEQYIVVGVGRGGTTAVAASLHVLGVSVGESGKNFSEDNYENFEMSRAFRSRDWRGLQKLITTYENQYSKFAWKLPDSNEQLTRIHKYFSNPYYIFVYRDLFAIANRKNITLDVDLIRGLQDSIDGYQRILKFVRRNKIKSLHVSYEKMLHDKQVYAEELANFCDVSASESLISEVASVIEASPTRYLQWASNTRIKLSGYEGHIDQVSKTLVSGWIVNKKSPFPVTIEVLINGKFIGEFVSDIFREDLIKAKKSASGKAGFRMTLPAESLKEKDVVTIKPIGCEDGISSLPFDGL